MSAENSCETMSDTGTGVEVNISPAECENFFHDVNLNLHNPMESVEASYPSDCLPTSLNPKTGKAKKCRFEEIDLELYEPEARMVAFHTSLERIRLWIKALDVLYYDILGQKSDINVTWVDTPDKWTDRNNPVNSIVIEFSDSQTKFKITFFVTTGTIQAQGNGYLKFANEHFPLLKTLLSRMEDNTELKEIAIDDADRKKKIEDADRKKKSEKKCDDADGKKKSEKKCDDAEGKKKSENKSDDANRKKKSEPITICENDQQESVENVENIKRTDFETKVLKTLQKLENSFCEFVELKSEFSTEKSAIKEKLDKLDCRVVSVEKMKEELHKDMRDQIKQNNNDQNSRITHLENKTKGLRQDLQKLQSNDTEQRKQYKIVQDENEKLKRQLHESQTDKQYLQTKVNNMVSTEIVNENLRDEIAKLKDELKTAADRIKSAEKENADLKQQLSANKLRPQHEDEGESRTTEQEVIDVDAHDREQKQPDILIVADSHGRNIDTQRMYKHQTVEVKILEKDMKTLDGAEDFLERADYSGKQTILLVGSNDVSFNGAEVSIEKMESIVKKFNTKFPKGHLNIVPALSRHRDTEYNKQAEIYCDKLQKFNSGSVKVINSLINDKNPSLFARDSIHLSPKGTAVLVSKIKAHLNPKLGLPSYRQRSSPPYQSRERGRPNRYTPGHTKQNNYRSDNWSRKQKFLQLVESMF